MHRVVCCLVMALVSLLAGSLLAAEPTVWRSGWVSAALTSSSNTTPCDV